MMVDVIHDTRDCFCCNKTHTGVSCYVNSVHMHVCRECVVLLILFVLIFVCSVLLRLRWCFDVVLLTMNRASLRARYV